MHDFFEVLGIPNDARASDVRRACARRVRRCHPDFHMPGVSLEGPASFGLTNTAQVCERDVAVDFVEASAFVERMYRAFFSPVN